MLCTPVVKACMLQSCKRLLCTLQDDLKLLRMPLAQHANLYGKGAARYIKHPHMGLIACACRAQERFAAEAEAGHHRFQWLPFGAGSVRA